MLQSTLEHAPNVDTPAAQTPVQASSRALLEDSMCDVSHTRGLLLTDVDPNVGSGQCERPFKQSILPLARRQLDAQILPLVLKF